MAIEIKIPKEINKYEAKAMGPFTLRQGICVLICLPVCVGIYLLTKPYVGVDIAGFLVIPPAVVAYLFGWYKPYGIKFEKYIKTVYISSFLAPSKRVYKTENYYVDVLKKIEKQEQGEELVKADTAGQKKAKEKKYKRSKLAIK